jgi:nitrite reductase (NADH) small subunit
MNASVLQWHPVCPLSELPVLGARQWLGGNEPIAVFRNAIDEVFAVADRCPHKGGPLSQGIVFGNKVACPLHNWTINLSSGCADAPDEGCATTYAVRIEDGLVLVGLPA